MDASVAYPLLPPPRLEVDMRSLKLYSPNGPRSGVVLVFLTQYDKNLWLAKISQVRAEGGGGKEHVGPKKKDLKVFCYCTGTNMETKIFYTQNQRSSKASKLDLGSHYKVLYITTSRYIVYPLDSYRETASKQLCA